MTRHFTNLTLSKTNEQLEGSDDAWGPLGLVLLHEPSDPLIDIIFVHGLGGGSRKTWSKTASIGHYWPQEWLPKEVHFKNVRIHAFGYDSNWKKKEKSNLTIHDFGQALIAAMHHSPDLNQKGKDTPIVWIGHSMGGIVTKKALLLAKQDPTYANIANRIHSMFFLATPHRGANIAELLNKVLRVTPGQGSKAYVDSLLPNAEAVQAINDHFRHVSEGIHLSSFFETRPTTLGIIVDKWSAILGYRGEETQLLNADHSNVCKFDSPSDNNYCTVRNALITTIASIEKTYLLSRNQQRSDQMKTLSRYLGLIETPMTDVANIIHNQTEGTCSWLTDSQRFLDWQQGFDGESKYYWLSGKPASGKSMAAGHVVRYLEECNCDCSYFFFHESFTGKSTVAELLCSLAWQMASSNNDVREKILAMCEEGATIDRNDEHSIWRDLYTTLILCTELRQPQYWVIDALDECTNYGVLFPFLAKVEEQFLLRVFLTSRPSLKIERLFSHENMTNIQDSIDLKASLGDIQLYLEEHADYILTENDSERNELIQIIRDMSNGNFLWTSLVMKKLEEAVSKEEVQRILNSVPTEIGDLYRHIMIKIMAAPTKNIARAIIRWTLCSFRPLSVDELKGALKFDVDETLSQLEKTAGSICGHLVSIDTESKVKIAHQTVREFLFENHDEFQFMMNRADEHARISDMCLAYLSSEEMKSPRFRRGISSRSKTHFKSPFAAYAMVYFSDHIARSSSSDSVRLASLNKFLINNSFAWIEAIASTQELAALTQTAKNLKAYLERRGKYKAPLGREIQNISEWADDLIHLVAQFGKALLSSPQAIHHLIPSVCPRQSIIFRTLKGHSRGLQVVGLSQEQWDDRLCCIVIPDTQVLSVAARGNRFALGSSNGRIYVYKDTTLQEKLQLVHGEPVRKLAFPTKHTYLASAGRRKICFWNTFTGENIWSHRADDEVLALAFSENDSILFAATKANRAVSWDTSTGKECTTFRFVDWDEDEEKEYHYQRPPMYADFSVGLGLLGVVYRMRPVNLWDLENHKFAGQFHRTRAVYPEPFIDAFLFNPKSEINLAAVTYQDGNTIVFDPETQEAQAESDTDTSILAASPDGMILATGSGDGIIKLYDFETMKLLWQGFVIQQDIRAIAFNGNGTRFFDIRGDYCNVWEPSVLVRRNESGDGSSVDISERDEIPVPGLSTANSFDNDLAIASLTVHHGSNYIFCGREDGSVAAFATKSGQLAQELYRHETNVAVEILVWNEFGNLLASADRSGRVLVRRLSHSSTHPFCVLDPIIDETPASVVAQMVLSPEGKRLLVVTEKHVTLWDLTDSTIVQKLSEAALCSSSKWASHPASDKLFAFTSGHVRAFDWSRLEDLSVDSNGVDIGFSDWALSCVTSPSQGRNIFAVLSSVQGSTQPSTIGIWPASALSAGHDQSATPLCQNVIARDLKAIIGSYKSWLIFLNHDGWVCSINMDTVANDTHYVRHVIVPLQWHSARGNTALAITPKGSVVLAVNTEVAVIHNALDFEEKVTVGSWMPAPRRQEDRFVQPKSIA